MSQLTLPTLITTLRLMAVPLVMVGLAARPWGPWWTLGFFCAAAWTDWLDGYLARRLQQESELGRFLDPLVDKLLVLGPLMSLVEEQVLPAWGVFLIVARDLVISGWRVSKPAVVGANFWGKLKTVVQLSAIAGLLVPPALVEGGAPLAPLAWLRATGHGLFWLSLPLTALSALIYLWPRPRGEA
jgi:CDP-diacylglycerol--glycerol-3-phosphate 3-phosphatidyltransferase